MMFKFFSFFLLFYITTHSCYAENKPHLVLIVADDLGWNDVSWHNDGVISPNLGNLAESGIILDQSYVLQTCTPTRSALMTGRYPFSYGRQFHPLKPFTPTGLTRNLTILPEYLRKEGYSTHAVGKWHLGYCNWEYTPTYRGFDTFHGFYNGGADYYTHSRTEEVQPSNGEGKGIYVHGYDFRENEKTDFSVKGEYSSVVFANRVENILYNRTAEDPMFLYIAFQNTHSPIMVPKKYSDMYKHIKTIGRRKFLGMVTAMDDAVGRIIKALKDTGHYENSVIVFTTDNGGPPSFFANNWPLKGGKATLWEGGTRGAAFIHSPLIKNSRTVNNKMIHVTDWFPTFISLAGGEVPPGIDGVDQWASITTDAPSARNEFVYNICNEDMIKAGIRIDNYKLLVGNPGHQHWKRPPARKYEELISTNTTYNVKEDSNENAQNAGYRGDLSKFNKPEEILNSKIHMFLYNLDDDPHERHNLAYKNTQKTKTLLERLMSYLPRYVLIDMPDFDYRGDPTNFGGVLSPGWC